MKTIWKYNLTPNKIIKLPVGADILCISDQHREVCMWVMVDPNQKELIERHFMVFGTGHDIPDDDLEYLGIAKLDGGSLIFHAFEVKPIDQPDVPTPVGSLTVCSKSGCEAIYPSSYECCTYCGTLNET